ncbi:MAG: hypothetical protein AAGA47_07465 [Pseudomonadota bacterium]
MASSIIVAPFAASVEALPGGTHFITDAIKVEPLADDLKMNVTDYLDSIDEAELGKLVRQRPAYTIPINDTKAIRALKTNAERCAFGLQIHRFCLEYFVDLPVPMISFLHDGSKITHHEIDRDGLLVRGVPDIEIPEDAWDKQITYARFAYDVAEKAPAIEPVMTRLCRAFREGPSPDGIIDLAIAMESLVQTKLEIKFQFSLFNALISSSEFTERSERRILLRNLYDARSITVHGGKPGRKEKPKISAVQEHWSDLIALARGNLTYYLNFCSHRPHTDWNDHLWALALGADRFTPEDEEHED